MGAFAFLGCSSLRKVVLPEGLLYTGEQAFTGCTELSSVGVVGSGASVEIPNSITTIGFFSFSNCTGLTNVTIPVNVTYIVDASFLNCTNLTDIAFEGTMAQWNAITKGSNWNKNVPATEVVCSDGTVAL
jgi:hypothetical protein